MADLSVVTEFEGCTYSNIQATHVNMCFSPDDTLFVYRWNNEVRVCDIADTFKIVKSFNNDSDWLYSTFSPDGRYLAVGDNRTSDKLSIYDMDKDSSVALIKRVEARCG